MTMVRQKDKDHLRANAVSEDVDHGEVGRVFLLLLVPLGSRSSPDGDHEDQDDQDGDDRQKSMIRGRIRMFGIRSRMIKSP